MCILYALQDPLSYNFGIQLSSCIAMISSQYTSLNELLSEYLIEILVTMTAVIWYHIEYIYMVSPQYIFFRCIVRYLFLLFIK